MQIVPVDSSGAVSGEHSAMLGAKVIPFMSSHESAAKGAVPYTSWTEGDDDPTPTRVVHESEFTDREPSSGAQRFQSDDLSLAQRQAEVQVSLEETFVDVDELLQNATLQPFD